MFHEFHLSDIDRVKCTVCRKSQAEHKCDICDGITKVEKEDGSIVERVKPVTIAFGNMLLCKECHEKELAMQAENAKNAEKRVQEVEKKRVIPQPDSSLTITADIFNSHIASIVELKKTIDADDSVPNKNFALADALSQRYQRLRNIISEANDAIKNASNESRAIQTYYNELAKKLKTEEREKIKISDVQYRPPDKAVKPIKKIEVKKPYDRASVKEASEQSGIPEMLIQITCVQRNCTPLEAVRRLRESGLDTGAKN